jgi:UDP-N-acetylglucosamine--N-acetylmuramyl-(pentapeptide) pyrophosphoryl-undecaprenol N-acetylglucosamine transferase
VVVVGGYASFPAGLAAVLTRVPLVCMTTDAVPGAVNGLLGRRAVANAVAFADTDLPRAHVTGTPVRPELATLHRTPQGQAASRVSLGLPPERQTVACAGGSLGARRVNRAVADLAEGPWAGCTDRSVYHVTGRRDYASFALGPARVTATATAPDSGTGTVAAAEAAAAAGARAAGGRAGAGAGAEIERDGPGLRYQVVPFEDRMPDFYNAADVCVVRAGAMTVAELLVAGVPAILVPLPGAPRDHQTRNAEALVGMGAAVLIPDGDCDGRRLALELDALLADPERLRAMREAAQENGHPDAAARVAELVDAHAR